MSRWELLAGGWEEDAFGISRRWSQENGFKKHGWWGLKGSMCAATGARF